VVGHHDMDDSSFAYGSAASKEMDEATAARNQGAMAAAASVDQSFRGASVASRDYNAEVAASVDGSAFGYDGGANDGNRPGSMTRAVQSAEGSGSWIDHGGVAAIPPTPASRPRNYSNVPSEIDEMPAAQDASAEDERAAGRASPHELPQSATLSALDLSRRRGRLQRPEDGREPCCLLCLVCFSGDALGTFVPNWKKNDDEQPSSCCSCCGSQSQPNPDDDAKTEE